MGGILKGGNKNSGYGSSSYVLSQSLSSRRRPPPRSMIMFEFSVPPIIFARSSLSPSSVLVPLYYEER